MSMETLKRAAALIAMINDGVTEEELKLPTEIREVISVLRAVNPDMYIYVEKGDNEGNYMENTFIKLYPRVLENTGCSKELSIVCNISKAPFFGTIQSPGTMLLRILAKAKDYKTGEFEEKALDAYMRVNPTAGAGRILNFMKYVYPEAVAEYESLTEYCSELRSVYTNNKESLREMPAKGLNIA